MEASHPNYTYRQRIWSALKGVVRESGIFALFGLIGAFVLLGLFADLTEDVFSNETTVVDTKIELWIHSFANSTLDAVFKFSTTMGSIASIIILTILTFGLLAWRKHLHSAWLLLIAVAGGILINQGIKFTFQRTRPHLWLTSDYRPSTFSFTSGHSTVSLCYFGMLIWLGFKFIKRPILRVIWAALMVFFIIMVGLSRVYLGVHYPSDVLGAYLSGGFWLTALLSGVAIYDRVRHNANSEKLSNGVEVS